MNRSTHKAKITELRQRIETLNAYPCHNLDKIFSEHKTITQGLRTYCKECGLEKHEY
jgi:hypothetical protein